MNTSVGLVDLFGLDVCDSPYLLERSAFIHNVRYHVESDGHDVTWRVMLAHTERQTLSHFPRDI